MYVLLAQRFFLRLSANILLKYSSTSAKYSSTCAQSAALAAHITQKSPPPHPVSSRLHAQVTLGWKRGALSCSRINILGVPCETSSSCSCPHNKAAGHWVANLRKESLTANTLNTHHVRLTCNTAVVQQPAAQSTSAQRNTDRVVSALDGSSGGYCRRQRRRQWWS